MDVGYAIEYDFSGQVIVYLINYEYEGDIKYDYSSKALGKIFKPSNAIQIYVLPILYLEVR